MTYLLTIIIIIEISWKDAKKKHTARNSRYVISHFMTVTWRFLTHPICPRRRRSLNLTKLLIVVFSERDTL